MRLINEDKLLLDIIDRGVDHIQTDDYAEICQIIAEQPTIQAVPIEVLQEIRQKTYKLHPVKRGDNEYANGAYDGMCRVIDIVCNTIDAKIKEITNETDN